MGIFNKLKNVLFEEEEIDEVVEETPSNKPVREDIFQKVEEPVNDYRPLPERNLDVKPKEPTFEKVENNDFSERELFRSESTFKFPAFDEDEFNTSLPKLKVEEPKVNNEDLEFKRKQERRNEYSRFDTFKVKEEVKDEKKRFKPSPVISPVYGILDKDYKAEDIKEAPKSANGNILTSKDLDVESVRAKAFGKLETTLEKNVRKNVAIKETYDVKKEEPKKKEVVKEEEVVITEEPILDDSHTLIEERAKTIDELLKDASDDVIEAEEILDDKNDSISFDDDEVEDIKEEVSHNTLENDTLENDLYDLIDSMYDNTEEGE